jgi:hypothetical protein
VPPTKFKGGREIVADLVVALARALRVVGRRANRVSGEKNRRRTTLNLTSAGDALEDLGRVRRPAGAGRAPPGEWLECVVVRVQAPLDFIDGVVVQDLGVGGKVLIDGGRREDDIDDRPDAELYDPDSGTFSPSGRTSYPGTFPATASLLMNDDVLVTLQYSCDPSPLAEVYDPSAGTFSPTGKMSKGRAFGASILLPDGKVFITGRDWVSYPNGSAEIYDPDKGTFSTTDDLVMRREEGHTATLLPSGKVLVTGGYNGSLSPVASVEIYDPATNGWTPAGAMAAARAGHTVTLLQGGRVLVTGGYSDSSAVAGAEVYDPATNGWTLAGAMAAARREYTARCW